MFRLSCLFLFCALVFSGCQKDLPSTSKNLEVKSNEFVDYTIRKGDQYCDKNGFKGIETSEMKFVVKFDSTAIYQTNDPQNQYDINKLYGFSDNNAAHHLFSARIGWRWSDNALRLFGYVYNNGIVDSKELCPVLIGSDVNCSIKTTAGFYIFTVDHKVDSLPRLSTTPVAKGYQLYPYFGGDETAPHEILIKIKEL
jgi:hypothetical protein